MASSNDSASALAETKLQMMVKSPASYADIFDSVPFPIDRSVLDRHDLLVGREGRLSVFYAPVDSINVKAKVVLVGLTPGWQQMRIAIDTYCSARRERLSPDRAQESAKGAASFAGMRNRIVMWLDELGLQRRLGIPSTGVLFDDRALLHTTSLIRYPVFVGEQHTNYRGVSPKPEDSPLLRGLISDLLVPELASIPNALVVPMGSAVSRAITHLTLTNSDRCLIGFPHPSGANGHGPKQFVSSRPTMMKQVQDWAVL